MQLQFKCQCEATDSELGASSGWACEVLMKKGTQDRYQLPHMQIYEKGRKLYPYSKEASTKHVILRIDVIKSLKMEVVPAKKTKGVGYFLVKRNDLEAAVEEHPLENASQVIAQGRSLQLTLDLSELDAEDFARGDSNAPAAANPPSLLASLFSGREQTLDA